MEKLKKIINALLKKFADLVLGKKGKQECSPEAKTESQNPQEKTDCGNDGIKKQENLKKAIVRILASNYRGIARSSEDTLLIFVQDSLFYDALQKKSQNGTFVEDLKNTLNDEKGISFADVRLSTGDLPSDINLFTEIKTDKLSGIFLRIVNSTQTKEVRKARITPVEGCGSTFEHEYILDSDEVVNLPGARYNIGVGKMPQIEGGVIRVNHIAIDDRLDSPQYDKNKYVSRAHAHITYSEEMQSFLLHVERGGSRLGGKRTHIVRGGGEPIEIDNVKVPHVLEDGDFIMLSRNVLLLFKKI